MASTLDEVIKAIEKAHIDGLASLYETAVSNLSSYGEDVVRDQVEKGIEVRIRAKNLVIETLTRRLGNDDSC